jgi:hypothetical protein
LRETASITLPTTSAFLALRSGKARVGTFLTLMNALSISAVAAAGLVFVSTTLCT